MDSAARLSPNAHKRVPFLYTASDVDWRKYDKVILEPVAIYTGADQQFGRATDADKSLLAGYAQGEFAQALAIRYAAASVPGPTTLRIQVTLTGLETNKALLATFTKVDLLGSAVNIARTVQGAQGSFDGSVSYAVEIYDSVSNRPLRAYVSKQYPVAENVAATFGALSAAKVGIRKGAKDLLKQLG